MNSPWNNVLLMVVGMGLVTYVPRALPLVYLSRVQMPPLARRFLENIPYAALGALIFPGVLWAVGDLRLSLAGAAAAFVLAYYELNLVLVVVGSILAIILLQFLL